MKLSVHELQSSNKTFALTKSCMYAKAPLSALFSLYCFAGLILLSQLLSCSKKDDQIEKLDENNDAHEVAFHEVKSEEEALFTKFTKDMPIYHYYQKIPMVHGVTNDPVNLIFNLQFELGYDFSNIKTLEKLSKFAIKIAGEVRRSIAVKTKTYLGDLNNHAEIETSILNLVNKIIAPDPKDTARVKDVIITELSLYDYR